MARERLARPEEAFQAFDRALALDPNNAYFLTDAANAAIVLGDLRQAKRYAERGVALYGEQMYDPGFGPVLYPGYGPLRAQLGTIAVLEKRKEDAALHFRKALEGEWKGDEASFALAALYLTEQLERPHETLEACRIAKARDPAFAAPFAAAGAALEALGQKDEAIAEYRAAIEKSPFNEEARKALARLGAARR
jgi:tetratricopeptide (TPR) repeat protein